MSLPVPPMPPGFIPWDGKPFDIKQIKDTTSEPDPTVFDFTESDLKEFSELLNLSESSQQMERIDARLQFPAFLAKHGKGKCDAMFEEHKRREGSK